MSECERKREGGRGGRRKLGKEGGRGGEGKMEVGGGTGRERGGGVFVCV